VGLLIDTQVATWVHLQALFTTTTTTTIFGAQLIFSLSSVHLGSSQSSSRAFFVSNPVIHLYHGRFLGHIAK